jgi:hypothetical protein
MSPRTTRWLLAALAVLLLSAAYAVRIRSGMVDFSVNYQAGQRLGAGETLYRASDGHYMFKYFPSSALIYLPLTALPLEAAKALWFAISVGALVWMFRMTRQLVPHPHVRRLWLLPGLILAKFFLHELRLGQINILLTAIMLSGFLALGRGDSARHQLTAGVSAGLAMALKPYAALLLPYFILTQRWKSVAAAVGVLLAALAIPALFYGVAGNLSVLRQWADTLSQSTPGLLANNDNVSVIAFFTKWTGDPGLALTLTAIVLGALAILATAAILRGRGDPHAPALDGALVLTLIPLVSPLGWDYTFLMSLPAVTLIVNDFRSFPVAARVVLAANFAVVALALYDTMGRQAYAQFMQWSVTTVNFIIIVCALAYLRFRKLC